MKTFRDFNISVPPDFTGEKYTTCPKCSRSRKKKNVKCLSANAAKGVWCCNHCGWAGSLDAGEGKRSNPPKFIQKPVWRKESKIPEKLAQFFKTRGISEQTLERYDVQVKEVYMPQTEDFERVICFPYCRGDEVVNVKYRDKSKNFRQEANAEKILYGLNDVANEKEIVIVEGEIDKLSFAEIKRYNVVSVPDGAPNPNSKNYEAKFSYLDNCKEVFDKVEKVILAVDSDEPGRKLEEELSRRIGRGKCFRVTWPDGIKDANECLIESPQLLLKCLQEAQPYPVSGLFRTRDFLADIYDLYKNGYRPGVSTGWACVDKLFKPRTGELTLITGIPSHGKSAFLDAAMVNIARESGWRFAVFPPENTPLKRYFSKLAQKYLQKPFNRGYHDRITEGELEQAIDWVDEHFFYILPDQNEEIFSLDKIMELARLAVYRHGVKGIVIDPWNDLDHCRERDMTETEYIGKCMVKMRNFSRKNDVHFFVVAHPTKVYKDKKTNRYPVPTPYMISGSANWYNKADNCLAVYRNFDSNCGEVEIHVQKIKFEEVGEFGECRLYYDKVSGCYSENTYEAIVKIQNGSMKEFPDTVPF